MAKQKSSKASDMKKTKRAGPKKALSTYLIFSMARREDILKEKPELRSNVTEISKIIGAEWRQMTEEEKRPYQLKHEQDKARYIKEKEEFDRQLSKTATTKEKKDDDAVSYMKPPPKKQKRAPVKKQVTFEEEDDDEEEEEEDEEEVYEKEEENKSLEDDESDEYNKIKKDNKTPDIKKKEEENTEEENTEEDEDEDTDEIKKTEEEEEEEEEEEDEDEGYSDENYTDSKQDMKETTLSPDSTTIDNQKPYDYVSDKNDSLTDEPQDDQIYQAKNHYSAKNILDQQQGFKPKQYIES